ncbi:hypothetical protein ASL14_07280 [Paenibacillus sp. IHB B 3084]|uniref:hypothetical protein n=1 Tax=Paenibacillus TaxID=44249 RepID=UPI000720B673|nr:MULTISPECIES: hypothetical protein [Paenibacillus]ALP36001.1 hypothetical protein ASL14_07280 [Paenibacillus sp. IHB B 3084]
MAESLSEKKVMGRVESKAAQAIKQSEKHLQSLQASGSTVESIVRLKKELKQFMKLMNVGYKVIQINCLIFQKESLTTANTGSRL